MKNLPDLAVQISPTIGEKFVVFTLGDELFAVSSKNVAEVAQSLEITALPKVPEWLLGVTNLRGEIVSVINLPKLLKAEISTNFNRPKLIVLRRQNAAVALATDRLNEIVNLPEEAIEPCKNASHIFATASHNSKILNLVDAEKLFEDL